MEYAYGTVDALGAPLVMSAHMADPQIDMMIC
jgi:hypothetical protein